MNRQEEYKRYIKKCEMLGTRMFNFYIDDDEGSIYIEKYIPSNERERIVKIPDFVDKIWGNAFFDVTQNLIVEAKNIVSVKFEDYSGEKLDLRDMNTTMIDDMGQMFAGCDNLKELNLSKFNTSNVAYMNEMFYDNFRLKEIDLSNFDTSSVISMHGMFDSCARLEKLDLSNFNTRKVNDMYSMFKGCCKLEELNISNFEMDNINVYAGMFIGCENLKIIRTNSKTKEWLERNRGKIWLTNKCIIKDD